MSRKRGPSLPAEDLEANSKNESNSQSSSSPNGRRSTRGDSSNKFQLTCLAPKDFKYPFVNQWYNIQLFLTDSKKAFKKDWSVPIQVDLLYEDGTPVSQPNCLEISPSTPPTFNGDGCLTLNLRFTQTSQWHENRAFSLRFSIAHLPLPRIIGSNEPLPSATLSMLHSIAPCSIDGFTVVKYRIKIDTQPPLNWYKDEGGRDKCMSVRGVLIDENDRPVTGQEVPLKVTLCYEQSDQSNGSEPTQVMNQSILRFAEGSAQKVDTAGKIEVKARIEEVSKNHQKQAFLFKISPDVHVSPANSDIAPAYTTAVTVLSKRNKRRKKDEHYTPLLNPMSMSMTPSLHSPLSTLARQSVAMQPPALPTDLRPSVPLTNALQAINNWCQYVIRGLNSLEWQHVGFEITENGDVHLQRPLHRCPSCWTYKDSIRPAQHNEKCMLYKAKFTFHNETHAYLQQLQLLAMGQQVKQEPSDPANASANKNGDDEDDSDDDSDDVSVSSAGPERSNRPGKFMDQSFMPQSINQTLAASSDDLPPVNPPMLPSFSQAFQNQSFMAGMNPMAFGGGSFEFPTMPASMVHGNSFSIPTNDPSYASFNPDEQQVYAIFLTGGMGGGECSLAAYTNDNRLLGFYVDESPNGVNLKPLSHYQSQPNWPQVEQFIKSRQAEYERAVASRQPIVLLRRDFPSIQRLKEAAVLQEYSKKQIA